MKHEAARLCGEKVLYRQTPVVSSERLTWAGGVGYHGICSEYDDENSPADMQNEIFINSHIAELICFNESLYYNTFRCDDASPDYF